MSIENQIATIPVLAREYAAKYNTPIGESEQIMKGVVEVMTANLARGNSLRLNNAFNVIVVEREARKGHNPATGEEIDIAAKKVLKVRTTKALEERMNG